jgi:hypothetical protein
MTAAAGGRPRTGIMWVIAVKGFVGVFDPAEEVLVELGPTGLVFALGVAELAS